MSASSDLPVSHAVSKGGSSMPSRQTVMEDPQATSESVHSAFKIDSILDLAMAEGKSRMIGLDRHALRLWVDRKTTTDTARSAAIALLIATEFEKSPLRDERAAYMAQYVRKTSSGRLPEDERDPLPVIRSQVTFTDSKGSSHPKQLLGPSAGQPSSPSTAPVSARQRWVKPEHTDIGLEYHALDTAHDNVETMLGTCKSERPPFPTADLSATLPSRTLRHIESLWDLTCASAMKTADPITQTAHEVVADAAWDELKANWPVWRERPDMRTWAQQHPATTAAATMSYAPTSDERANLDSRLDQDTAPGTAVESSEQSADSSKRPRPHIHPVPTPIMDVARSYGLDTILFPGGLSQDNYTQALNTHSSQCTGARASTGGGAMIGHGHNNRTEREGVYSAITNCLFC